MERAVHGKVVLRCAICGTGTKELEIEVNGAKVGKIKDLSPDGVITRHGTQGMNGIYALMLLYYVKEKIN